eukprot:scaffold3275_cov385-Prasinococcus_capsulatus_cf.AAC.4
MVTVKRSLRGGCRGPGLRHSRAANAGPEGRHRRAAHRRVALRSAAQHRPARGQLAGDYVAALLRTGSWGRHQRWIAQQAVRVRRPAA